jgi:TetR/AcrR family transcriptional regulator, cholesterol catabolism regulator
VTAARRAEILRVAADVFAARGYEAASLTEIAERLGMVKASLYHYFPSKDALLLEVLLGVYRGGREILDRNLAQPGPVDLRLRRIVRDHVLYFVNNAVANAVYLHESHQLPSSVRRVLGPLQREYRVLLRDLVVEGQKDGTLRRDLDADVLTLQLLGSVHWMYRWYQGSGPRTAGEIGDQLAEVILAGAAV